MTSRHPDGPAPSRVDGFRDSKAPMRDLAARGIVPYRSVVVA